jgi:hypothetical protein
MISVVDDEIQGLVKVGSAPPARRARRFMDDDAYAGVDQAHRGAKASNAGSDDMDDPIGHRKP